MGRHTGCPVLTRRAWQRNRTVAVAARQARAWLDRCRQWKATHIRGTIDTQKRERVTSARRHTAAASGLMGERGADVESGAVIRGRAARATG